MSVIHVCICYNYACFICVNIYIYIYTYLFTYVFILLYYAEHKVSLVKNTTDNRTNSGLILYCRT